MKNRSCYHIKRSIDKQYYFVIVANNNQIVATSEMYKSKQGCRKGIIACYLADINIIDTTKKTNDEQGDENRIEL
jgi:uncharacterized protein YegP (UPF0339 family)